MKGILLSLAIGAVSLTMAADDFIYLTKDNVNLRESPSTSAAVVEKGKKGTVFVVEEKQAGWYKGKNAQYGDTPVWISTSVAEKGYVGDVTMPAWNVVGIKDANIPYVNTETKSGGEVHTNWSFTSPNPNFFHDEKPGSEVEAISSISLINKNGSARTYETNYKGLAYSYYLILTEESNDGGDSYTKLETPIYVYPSIGAESGIYIDGVLFNDDVLNDDEW